MTGRNIEFTIKVGSSPQALAELKKFGEAARAEQKKIWSSAAADAKRYMDDLKKSMGGGLVVQIKKEHEERKKQARSTALDIQKIQQRAEMEDFKFRQRLAVQHHNEEKCRIQELKNERLKAARDEARELAMEARRAAMAQRNAHTRHLREQQLMAMQGRARWGAMEGVGRMGHGVLEIGTGVAMSGLVGEEDSQKVLDTLMTAGSILQTYRGGADAIKGARSVVRYLNYLAGFGAAGASGAAALGGGALAVGGAGTLAALGTIGGGLAAYDTIRDARRFGFGGGATPGSFDDRVSTGLAGFSYGINSMMPDVINNWSARNGDDTARAVQSARAAARMQKEHAASMGMRSELAKLYQDYADRKLQAAGERGGDVRGTFRDAATRLQNLPQNAGGEVRAQAEAYVLESRSRLLDLLDKERQKTIETARERVSGAREALQLMREQYSELKRQASEAKQNYGSDLARFGLSSPEEQARLREIARKRMAGEELTEDEIRAAQGYNEFGSLAQSEAERRARAAGAGDIFTSGRSEAERLAKEAAGAAASVSKAEVALKQQVEVVVRLEGDASLTDELLDKFKPVLDAITERLNRQSDQMGTEIDRRVRAVTNARAVK